MSKKRKIVSGKRYPTKKLKMNKNSSPILMSLCILLLLLIILPIAIIMCYSSGNEMDNEYGVEKVAVEKKISSSTGTEKEVDSVDANLMKSKATIKSPAMAENQKSVSSIIKEDHPVNKAVIPEEGIPEEESEIREAPIENTQNSDETNPIPPQFIPKYHTVQEGEGLWRIAKNNNLTLEEIKELNHLTSDIIQVGQSLLVEN